MARYDRFYDRGYGARRPRIWGRGDAPVEFTDFDELGGEAWGPGARSGAYGGRGGFTDGFRGGQGGYGRESGDRGEYGGEYPGYGGVPGSHREGMYYGGAGGGMQRPDGGHRWQPRGYDAGYMGGFTRGYDRGMVSGRVERTTRYGGDFAREPFMPETAYLRHPEYETPSTYHQQRWEGPGEYVIQRSEPLDDAEIRNEVRQRLYRDTWLHADDIDVSVSGGVVTLRGEVHDFLEARYAWDDAWETEGVRGVVNNLTVSAADTATRQHGDMFAQDTGDAGGTGSG